MVGFSSSSTVAKFIATCLCAAAIAGFLCSLAFASYGKVGIEKTLTALVFPLGLLWLMLSGNLLRQVFEIAIAPRTASDSAESPCGNRQSPRIRNLLNGLNFLWLLISLFGSPFLADQGFAYLESVESVYQPGKDGALDAVVVLGGGTRQTTQRVEGNDAGDRALYAAQLYFQRRAKRLIATGSSISDPNGELSPAEQTSRIWIELGVSESDIQTISGVNTYAEIQSLKKLLASGLAGQRVGLLTSAWHLPRAMRLARQQGLSDLIPVAADHRSMTQRLIWEYIPSGQSFERLDRCQRELMAAWVKR